MRPASSLAVAFLALAITACSGNDADPAPTSPAGATATPRTEAPAPAAAARFGAAGIIPPNWPSPSEEDWQVLYDSYLETGGLVGAYANWRDDGAEGGGVPQVVQVAFAFSEERDLTPVVALGVKRDAGPGAIASTVDWSDRGERAAFVETAVAVAEELAPEYLMLGVEVNRLWELLPADFDGFVSGYAEAFDAVKAAAPETKVFTVFQYEMLRGEGFLIGASETREPQWELLERFAGRLDLLGFTTYPYLDFETPDAIPDSYYAEIAERFPGVPVAFTEIGWPSRPLEAAPESGYGGSSAEQVAFVERFGELTADLPLEIALWSFPHDVGAGAPAPFESISLRENGGAAKPALAAWQALFAE